MKVKIDKTEKGKKDYSEEVRRFKGMFNLWAEQVGCPSATEWLAAHVGRLIAEVEELKKKIKRLKCQK